MKSNAEISNKDFSIKFLGAASGMVTGSLYRLNIGESRIVVENNEKNTIKTREIEVGNCMMFFKYLKI